MGVVGFICDPRFSDDDMNLPFHSLCSMFVMIMMSRGRETHDLSIFIIH